MDYNGGAAHAFFYGLCSLPGFDETQTEHLHGVVVGFGVLVLLIMDGQEEECRKMQDLTGSWDSRRPEGHRHYDGGCEGGSSRHGKG